jgi:hypothetical protein
MGCAGTGSDRQEWQGGARRGKAGLGVQRPAGAGSAGTRLGGKGPAGLGAAGTGMERQERRGVTRRAWARPGKQGPEGHGSAGRGRAWLGTDGRGRSGQDGPGAARRGADWQEWTALAGTGSACTATEWQASARQERLG